VRAELKSLDAVDAPGSVLDAFRPADGEHFGLAVTATIGPANGEGGELFHFNVCSPSWLAAEDRPKGFAFQRVLLIDRAPGRRRRPGREHHQRCNCQREGDSGECEPQRWCRYGSSPESSE
jgi:hypothetical protein